MGGEIRIEFSALGLAIAIVVFLGLHIAIPAIIAGQTPAGLAVSFFVWVIEGLLVVALSMAQDLPPSSRFKIGLGGIASIPLLISIKAVEFLSGNK
ncbi:MAG: hypothetical protein AAB443_03100 [Patescibacteria group bacterium]